MIDKKLDALRERLRQLESVVVCYSGGLDSGFTLAVAHEQLGHHAVGLTAAGPALAPRERDDAIAFARQIGADHEMVDAGEIGVADYVANGPDRCFHCKSALYVAAERYRQQRGFRHVINGTNLDDLGDYRPGLEAAKRANIVSPLVDVGFTKSEVREAARLLGLRLWDKPAAACLASRIPYGTAVTSKRLSQIAGFEAELRDLGFRVVRVRHHDTIARIEVGEDELAAMADPTTRQRVHDAGKRYGFSYVTLNLGAYRVGSHNEVLDGRRLRTVT
ncbi:MAG TPA: ATP-dependent sacrificial sulfur transferase LarE [Polyangiaceae bacterium]|nr:ATP-dependent sacrificial sulfur transferase LarE [Polyangiaceae bacterium]